ncbi:MAG: NADH:ubiquinone reductase (Na(+)-transporting) subunit F [Spirochaetaceae bacterium]|nr:NADH:ubiquinone reductase (Na(+)-transporting) subunit F [Spirochaetaceae bacterium]|tara:strand:- start:17075 stop:18307 length:1233 start_codon:yes stop_codon:yes gene_type:complete
MENLLIIGLSAAVFTAVIIGLVAIITVLERKLVAQGNVHININDNDEKSIDVAAGSNLLSALSEAGIYLPSACGGGGTCAMCRCQITEGGGDILPTEEGHFSRKEIKEQWRLSCQVKVKNDMKIHVPDEIFSIQKFKTKVRSNNNVATFIKELVLEIEPGSEMDFDAGGYIQIYIPPYHLNFKEFDVEKEYHEDWDKFNLWRYNASNDEEIFRAYSMANHPAEGNIVMLNVRIATPPPNKDVPPGIASSYIFNLKPGDEVDVSGPYGEFFIKETDREMVYIGGGAGMAPLRSHIFHLFHTLKTGRKVSYWYGARSLREVFYEEHFREIEKQFPNFSFHLALSDPLPEDKYEGPTGFIHEVVLREYLDKHEDPSEIEYYLCGPPLMLSAVQKMLYDLGVEKEMIAFDDFGN